MKILGISAFYHDSGAVLIEDGEIIAAAQEERFTRKKHDKNFPKNAANYCLKEGACSVSQLDAVVFYEKPLLKFERLIETYYAFAPKGFSSFVKSMPIWLKEKLFLKENIRKELSEISQEKFKGKLLFPEHHLSHAASAFFPSPFDKAAILTVDGVGEWGTATISRGEGNKIEILREMKFPHSVGMLYSAFTYYLGFKVNSGEYKLMGLAPYGDPSSSNVLEIEEKIKNNLINIKKDGSIYLNQKYFDYCAGLTMTANKEWENLFGFPPRKPESELKQIHCDAALAIQKVTEEIVIKMAETAAEITGCENLCLSGGVALNCVANEKILNSGAFKNIWIQPASGDAGGALGCALAAYHIYFQKDRKVLSEDSMKGSYLGPEFSEKEIETAAKQFSAVYETEKDEEKLCEKTAAFLAEGKVVGWFQGKMEWGPRALGNRSILGDPRNAQMQKKLNLKIKYRESFRPFAPSVIWEDAKEYFETNTPSPYMLLTAPVKKLRRKPLPENYHKLDIREKLYFLRSDIPAITHLDYSARLQTVHRETNPLYHKLISSFKKLTGYGVIVNTSFNVRGEPIVMTPQDAYKCFMRTEMDVLIMGNKIFEKTKQPAWPYGDEWKKDYVLD
ncbi:MAG: carbamoyltransferase [Elusimicrobia bacterium]|nr:carbamoyltransferase [Elusimicrobiota bacterium]